VPTTSTSEKTGNKPGNASAHSRRFLLWLGGITLLALLLRLAVSSQLARHPSVATPLSVTDMATYRETALNILKGEFPKFYYYQPFYYAVFLPLIYFVSGPGPWGVILVQCLLGAGTVWLTGLTAARCFNRRTGLIAAGLLALARFHIFYSPFLLIAILQGFWLTLLTYLTVRAVQTRRIVAWCLCALVAGLATLTRGNILLLLPGILGVLCWSQRQSSRRLVFLLPLFLVLFYLPQLPFALKNYHHFQRWTGPSSAQDAVLALSNNPESPPGGLEYPETYHDWMRQATAPEGTRIPVSRQILHWVQREPLQFLELKFRSLLLFWSGDEIPNNIAMESEGRASGILRLPILLDFSIIGAFALAGLLTTLNRLKNSPRLSLLQLTVWGYCAATVAFYILARFRLPVVPLLCVFAGFSIDMCLRYWKCRRQDPQKFQHRAIAMVGFLTLGTFITGHAFEAYQRHPGKTITRWIRPHGTQVSTPQTTLIYDHGPLTCGGWYTEEIPEAGMTISKRLILPSLFPGTVISTPSLRIPLFAPNGGKIRLRVQADTAYPAEKFLELKANNDVQWVTVNLPAFTVWRPFIDLTVNLATQDSPMGVFLDQNRNYFRTQGLTFNGSLSIEAEAAFELAWPTGAMHLPAPIQLSPPSPAQPSAPPASTETFASTRPKA
jgi:4-amino-4-deoxy-L-arabinose transferase-like glycosyltransferase